MEQIDKEPTTTAAAEMQPDETSVEPASPTKVDAAKVADNLDGAKTKTATEEEIQQTVAPARDVTYTKDDGKATADDSSTPATSSTLIKSKTITINTNKDEDDDNRDVTQTGKDRTIEDGKTLSSSCISAASQARTPKHANKTKDGEDQNVPGSEATGLNVSTGSAPPDHASLYPGCPSRSFEGRPLGGGAFQPTDAAARRQQHHYHHHSHHPTVAEQQFYSRSPMHISPGGGRYYDRRGIPPGYHSSLPPPGPYYESRVGGYNDFGGPVPSIRSFEGGPGGPPPHMYHQYGGPPPSHSRYGGGTQSYDPRYGNGDPRGYHPHGSAPPHYSGHGFPQHGLPPENFHHGPGGPGVSRTVSSSFDRSSKDSKPVSSMVAKGGACSAATAAIKSNDDGDGASMASDDDSWKQLKQVHSIDDSAIQDHLGKAGKTNNTDDEDRHPPSTSSSLTNSPTDGPERRAKAAEALLAAAAAAAKQQSSSLDELSSVASAQPPMDTSDIDKRKMEAPESPATHDSSLDILKCPSASSALLLPSHQGDDDLQLESTTKRDREEDRGDAVTSNDATRESNELRHAPSGVEDEPPPNKKAKIDAKRNVANAAIDSKFKSKSPESIEFSPSAINTAVDMQQLKPLSSAKASPHPGENSFYDKPPTYSYSIDSAPPLPGGVASRRLPAHPVLPPRPGSSASSSLTHGHMQDPSNAVVASIPSWEIQAQDSFGAGSVGGVHGLTNNFSFQDYMLSAVEAANAEKSDGGPSETQPTVTAGGSSRGYVMNSGGPPPHLPPGVPPHLHSHAAIESRNQSFEGGYYHGSFDMGYPGPGRPMGNSRLGPMMADPGFKHGHAGQFPPHAPSWGSGGSHMSYQGHPPPGHHYNRMGDYPIMRNYSQDSGHRASPPPGPPGGPRHYMHHQSPVFQPPPEFAVPSNPMGRRPPPAVYIMSSQGSNQQSNKRGGAGAFSWTKDDDIRLTDIMKKYKNPRDWEPISKELGVGKTAKECHERWIRYLKPGVRKGQWTDQEDAIVMEAVQTSSEQPFTRWSDLAQRLPGRVGKQIRDRWVNHLNPNINHLPFSREDDLLLWEGHKKLGKRWVEISMKFFNSSRSENHIKNRWYSASFKKFITNEFGLEAYTGGKETKGEAEKPVKSKRKSSKIDDDPATHAVGI